MSKSKNVPRVPIRWDAVTYNASILAGTSMVGVGAGARWGWQIGFVGAGAVIIALTLFAALFSRQPPSAPPRGHIPGYTPPEAPR